MAERITVHVQPFTPVWTGDAAGSGSHVRETGILGSLRWWYEALLRGLGHYACDPSQGTCIFDKDTGLSSICLACQVFGCTGFSRRFRLTVEGGGDAGQPKEVRLKNPANGQQHRGWRIPPNLASSLKLVLLPLSPGGITDFERGALFYTLSLIERYGALGAKASQGQGVVRVTDWGSLSTILSLDNWKATLAQRKPKVEQNPSPAPALADFVGATITLDPASTSANRWWDTLPLTGFNAFNLSTSSPWIPSAPAVRAHLRGWLRDQGNFKGLTGSLADERHRLMGVVQGQNTRGSNIFVTHLYRPEAQSPWTMRIFGFVPGHGNAVDLAVRALLQDKQKLASEVQAALGGVPVTATPYPDQIAALLEASRGQANE